MPARNPTVQIHADCLTAIILDSDDVDYSDQGDTGICGSCRRRYDAAARRARRIIAAHEASSAPYGRA